MLSPEIAPDEIYSGYWGRIKSINGFPKNDIEALKILALCVGAENFVDPKPKVIELLAWTANMSIPEFVRQHTFAPYRRAIVSHKPESVHGDPGDLTMLSYAVSRMARPYAYACVDCIEEDIRTRHFSYWHRSHQLPGMYFCEKHERALWYTDDANSFLIAPENLIHKSRVINKAWAASNHSHGAVREFLKLSMAMAERPYPLDLKRVRLILCGQAREKGFATHPKSTNEFLSDRIKTYFPEQWLDTVFPAISAKETGKALDQIDGTLYLSKSSSSIAAYLLVSCVLFESADHALAAFDSKISIPHIRTPKSDRFDSVSEEELKADYVICLGRHGDIAKKRDLPVYVVANLLNSIGLPNLSISGKKDLLDAARNFYILGYSIPRSAEQAGVSLEDLERVVRSAGLELKQALRKIFATKRGSRPPSRATKALHLMGLASSLADATADSVASDEEHDHPMLGDQIEAQNSSST